MIESFFGHEDMVQKFYEFVFKKPLPEEKVESVLSRFGDMSLKSTNVPQSSSNLIKKTKKASFVDTLIQAFNFKEKDIDELKS